MTKAKKLTILQKNKLCYDLGPPYWHQTIALGVAILQSCTLPLITWSCMSETVKQLLLKYQPWSHYIFQFPYSLPLCQKNKKNPKEIQKSSLRFINTIFHRATSKRSNANSRAFKAVPEKSWTFFQGFYKMNTT